MIATLQVSLINLGVGEERRGEEIAASLNILSMKVLPIRIFKIDIININSYYFLVRSRFITHEVILNLPLYLNEPIECFLLKRGQAKCADSLIGFSTMNKCSAIDRQLLITNVMSSLVATPNYSEERRKSVLPTHTPNLLRPNSSTLDPDYNGPDDSTGSSLFRRASFAANSFRRMSKVFRDEGPTKGFLRAAIGDPNKPKYMQLSMENDELHAEWKRLKGFVQNFHEEYEASKGAVMMDPYRRYKRLCAMVKKLVLHLRLNDPAPNLSVTNEGEGGRGSFLKGTPSFAGGQVLQSSVKEREMRLKHSNMCDCKLHHFLI